MNGIEFNAQDELRILSAALCMAQEEADDGGELYNGRNDASIIRTMKLRVDGELHARYQAKKTKSKPAAGFENQP